MKLLRSVKASNGQEFGSGWVCGFAPATATALIESGMAVPLTQDEPALDLEVIAHDGSPSVVDEPQTVPVTSAPISTGEAPEVEPVEPSKPQPTSKRRK